MVAGGAWVKVIQIHGSFKVDTPKVFEYQASLCVGNNCCFHGNLRVFVFGIGGCYSHHLFTGFI